MRFSNAIVGGLAFGSFSSVAAAIDYTVPASWTVRGFHATSTVSVSLIIRPCCVFITQVPTVNASYPVLRDRAQKAINVLRDQWWNDMSKFDCAHFGLIA